MVEVSGRCGQLLGAASRAAIMVATGLIMGGCAGIGEGTMSSLFAKNTEDADIDPTKASQSELQKATEYWGKQYSEKPADLDNALNYAKNLKALGQKQQALAVLQQASMLYGTDRRLSSEYGRLALELDQISIAEQLLAAADDPAKPDWRVISARGTVLSKKGKYAEAIPYYERALTLSADQPSVMNNLALAYAMNGEAGRAEEVLRRISASGASSAKVRQNLALVLGLQGKYDEATKVGAESGSTADASSNTAVIKKMVRLDPKPYAPGVHFAGTWQPVVAAGMPTGELSSAWQTKVAPARSAAPVKTADAMGPPAPAAEAAAPSMVLRPSSP